MRRGERRTFLVGVGHGTCTCEGAAFEYIVNLEFELRNRGVRDRARDHLAHQRVRARRLRHGRHAPQARRLRHAEQHLQRVAVRRARHRLDHARPRRRRSSRPLALRDARRQRGASRPFDFAMLLPPFSGVGLKAFDRDGGGHHGAAVHAQRVHARRRRLQRQARTRSGAQRLAAHLPVPRLPEHLRRRHRLRAAAPDLDARTRAPTARVIAPAPPRTGMPSATIGKAVAGSIVDMIGGADEPTHTPRWPRWAQPASPRPGANPSRARPPR